MRNVFKLHYATLVVIVAVFAYAYAISTGEYA